MSTELIDWPLAARVARAVAGAGPETTERERAAVRDDFRELSARSDELVRGFTGLATTLSPPEPRVLSRSGWVRANIEGFRGLVAPLSEKIAGVLSPAAPTRVLARAGLGVQVGVLLGYLSQKVLGQYDLLLASGGTVGSVYYVGPNVIETERRTGLDPRDFRLWIALHEITHRTQFTSVPWLRARVAELMQRSIDMLDLDPARVRAVLERGRRLLLAGPRAWRSTNIMSVLLSEEQQAVVAEMQALMCVVEGHGTFVMNRLGERHITSWPRMKPALDAKRASARGAERLFQRAIGMDMKLEQYALGERFMNEVAAIAGEDAVNVLWHREENLPGAEELRDPRAWLARVRP